MFVSMRAYKCKKSVHTRTYFHLVQRKKKDNLNLVFSLLRRFVYSLSRYYEK